MGRSNQSTNDLAIKPIRARRAFEDVILQVRKAISEHRLKVGDRLPHERELATQFQVSRQSVREGLRMLEAFGVLAPRRGVGPDSGWIVSANGTTGLSVLLDLYTSLQKIPLWDLLEIREALEMLSVRSAAKQTSAEEAAGLVESAQAMVAITDREAFLNADAEFHVAIARKSGNSLAPLFMEAIREAMSRAMLSGFETVSDWPAEREQLLCEHLEIANNIRAGRGDGAADALSKHIRGFYGRALREFAESKTRSVAK